MRHGACKTNGPFLENPLRNPTVAGDLALRHRHSRGGIEIQLRDSAGFEPASLTQSVEAMLATTQGPRSTLSGGVREQRFDAGRPAGVVDGAGQAIELRIEGRCAVTLADGFDADATEKSA